MQIISLFKMKRCSSWNGVTQVWDQFEFTEQQVYVATQSQKVKKQQSNSAVLKRVMKQKNLSTEIHKSFFMFLAVTLSSESHETEGFDSESEFV